MAKQKVKANIEQNPSLAPLSQEGGEAKAASIFKPCGYGCEVNAVGDVRRICDNKILKPQDRKNIGPQRYCISYKKELYYPARWYLVAVAWIEGFEKTMWVTWRNNNMKDCRVENLEPCTYTEFRRWNTNRKYNEKAERLAGKFGEFRPTYEPGIECTKEGVFKVDGRISNHHVRMKNGKVKIHSLEVRRNGINKYYPVKPLIYSAWNGRLMPDNMIIPANGDWCSIHADNLIQVTTSKYRQAAYAWQSRENDNDANILPTIDDEIKRLEEIKMECQLCIDYLKTGDWSGYHKYIAEDLYDYLMCYAIKSLDQSRSWAEHNVSVVISDLYDLISTNRIMYSPKMFCVRRLKRFLKDGVFYYPHKARPVAIQRAIDKQEIDKLAAKFNNDKIKKFHAKSVF